MYILAIDSLSNTTWYAQMRQNTILFVLSFAQPLDSLLHQPEWNKSKSCGYTGANDQPKQIAIDDGVIEELCNPPWGYEQPKRDRQIKHCEDLSKTPHDTTIHFTRIIPGEVRPGDTKRQQDASHPCQAHDDGDETINKLQNGQPLHNGDHSEKGQCKTQGGLL